MLTEKDAKEIAEQAVADFLKRCSLQVYVNIEKMDYSYLISGQVTLRDPEGNIILRGGSEEYRDSFS